MNDLKGSEKVRKGREKVSIFLKQKKTETEKKNRNGKCDIKQKRNPENHRKTGLIITETVNRSNIPIKNRKRKRKKLKNRTEKQKIWLSCVVFKGNFFWGTFSVFFRFCFFQFLLIPWKQCFSLGINPRICTRAWVLNFFLGINLKKLYTFIPKIFFLQ